jgi:hypothetical protein
MKEGSRSVDHRQWKSALGALEMVSAGLIDDLGNGQVVEVSLPPDGLDPAAFDMEGSSLNAFQVQKNARILLVILKVPTIVPRICRYCRPSSTKNSAQ